MAAYEDYIEYLKHVRSTTEQDIRTEIDRLNGTIATLKDTVSSLNKAKDNLASELVRARRDTASKTDELNVKEQEIRKITAEVNAKNNEINDLSKKLNEAKMSLTEETKQKVSLNEKLSKELEKTKSLTNEVASVREQLSNLKLSVSNENKTISDKLNNSLRDLRDTQAKLDVAEIQKTQLLQKCTALENELANIKRQGVSSDGKMQSELTELSKKLSNTLKSLAAVQANLDEANRQKSQIQQKCASLEHEMSELKSKSHSSAANTTEISNKLSNALKSLAAAQSNLDEANRQKAQLERKCVSLEKKSIALEEQYEETRVMNDLKQKDLQKMLEMHKKYKTISIIVYIILILCGIFVF